MFFILFWSILCPIFNIRAFHHVWRNFLFFLILFFPVTKLSFYFITSLEQWGYTKVSPKFFKIFTLYGYSLCWFAQVRCLNVLKWGGGLLWKKMCPFWRNRNNWVRESKKSFGRVNAHETPDSNQFMYYRQSAGVKVRIFLICSSVMTSGSLFFSCFLFSVPDLLCAFWTKVSLLAHHIFSQREVFIVWTSINDVFIHYLCFFYSLWKS